MRKEVENVISGGVKQTVINSNDFKKFLTAHGLYEKEYAPRSRKGAAWAGTKKAKFDITEDEKIGDTKTITFEDKQYTVKIEDIETVEENVANYPYIDASNTENHGFHYKEVPMTLTREEETALYDYYMSMVNQTWSTETYKRKPIATVLETIGIILCLIGFILGIVVGTIGDDGETIVWMFFVWIGAFVLSVSWFALATIIDLLNENNWNQSHK